jgi:hypothetical protein
MGKQWNVKRRPFKTRKGYVVVPQITSDFRNGKYEILYADQNGISILFKSANLDIAEKKFDFFKRKLERKELLKEVV